MCESHQIQQKKICTWKILMKELLKSLEVQLGGHSLNSYGRG